MSQTNHGKHAKVALRGGGVTLGKRGLLLAALAVLVAAVVAIPGFVAMAAGQPTIVITPSYTPETSLIEGEDVWSTEAQYTAAITMDGEYELIEDETTISGSKGSVAFSENVAWTSRENEDGTKTYLRSFTVGESSHNEISVNAVCQQVSADGETTGERETASLKYDRHVTVDMSVPEVTITMSQPTIGNADGTDYFGERGLSVTIEVKDPTFDTEEARVVSALNLLGTKLDWAPSSTEEDTYVATFDNFLLGTYGISKDYMTLSVGDKLNHKTEFVYGDAGTFDKDGKALTGEKFSVDTNRPSISFTLNGEAPQEDNHFTGDVEVAVKVTMSNFGSTTLDGDSTWTKTNEGEDSERRQTYVYTKTFSEEGSQNLSVTARKTDGIKWEATAGVDFTIDKTAPTMKVDFNDLAPVEGSYFNAARTATITVEEALGFSADEMKVLVNGKEQDLTWITSGSTHTATVAFAEDGTYELEVSGSDLAGNDAVMADDAFKTEYSSGEFVIDTTDPTITVTCNNDNAQNGMYYKADREFTIVVKDVNLDVDELVVTKDDSALADAGWEKQSDGSYKAVVEFNTDGTHSLEVQAQDKSDNSATYESDDFVIDKTAPVINVRWSGVGTEVEKTYFNGNRTATITVEEDNFDSKLIEIETTGKVGEWNEEEQSVTVEFDSDGTYRLTVDGGDLAGNPATTYDSGTFHIDTTAPVLSVVFSDNDSYADKDGSTAYYGAERSATITVVEKNFDPSRVTVTGEGAKGEWQNGENDTHTLVVTFPEAVDSYEMNVSVSDRAGNEGVNAEGEPFEYESGTFVVDTTPATVSIALDKAIVKSFSGSDYFADAPTATVTVRDVNFKPSASVIDVNGGTVSEWVEGETDSEGVTTWTATVSFSEGVGRTMTVNAIDWAAHKTVNPYGTNTVDVEGTELVSGTLVADLTAPEVTSASVDHNPSNNYGDNYYFNVATTLTVNVSDNIGIESLTMTDADDGTYVLDNQVNVGATSGSVVVAFLDGYDFDRAVIVRTTDIAGNYRYWSISPTGEVKAVNYADPSNEPVFDGTYPESMLQDTVFPVVSLSGVTPGTYYNSPQSVLLSVEELNIPILKTYDPNQVVLTVTQVAGDASRATSTWTRPVSQLTSTGAGIGYALSEPLSADGHYTISAQVTDPALNQATAELAEFTIDQTAPVVEITFDNNDVRNGKYYKAGRTATITVTEHNFDPALVTIETNGAVGSWSTSGDVHTITVSFTTDGVYNLSVSGADMAGNAMAAYQADEFVVDLQAPEITFDGVEEMTAYNDSVQPVIIFTDEANFDVNGVSYTITGTKNGEVAYEAFASNQEQGQTVTYSDFVREPDVDDIYTINANMTDLAGNEAEGAITFSVNRFGSTFRVLDADSYTENDGYLLEGRDVVVEEINVSGVESEKHGVTVTEGTSVSQLTLNETPQSTGYTIEAGTSEDPESNGWSVYTYRIPAGNFVRDGRYHVSVESEDLAANTNTSSNYYDREAGKTAAAEVDFILDTTDPVVMSLNIEDGAVYETGTYEGTFTVVENIGVREVEVLVDGEAVEATDDGYGNYSFKVESASFTPRSLSITATDLAGRTGSAGADDFRVTTDIFELHLPWVIAGIVAAVVVAGGAIYFFVIKPKRDEDEDAKKAA